MDHNTLVHLQTHKALGNYFKIPVALRMETDRQEDHDWTI